MQQGEPYEFGFDESHEQPRTRRRRTCPACEGPLQATRLVTRCRDCGLIVDSERGQ